MGRSPGDRLKWTCAPPKALPTRKSRPTFEMMTMLPLLLLECEVVWLFIVDWRQPQQTNLKYRCGDNPYDSAWGVSQWASLYFCKSSVEGLFRST